MGSTALRRRSRILSSREAVVVGGDEWAAEGGIDTDYTAPRKLIRSALLTSLLFSAQLTNRFPRILQDEKKKLRFIYKNSNELFRKTATWCFYSFFFFFRSSCTLFILGVSQQWNKGGISLSTFTQK
jgi:hypothetical protein